MKGWVVIVDGDEVTWVGGRKWYALPRDRDVIPVDEVVFRDEREAWDATKRMSHPSCPSRSPRVLKASTVGL